jgi:ATP-dependent DNA helicase RecG
VQGDVGSGKTAVAAAAMYAMHKSGYNSCLMAPTEILAQQHYKTLKALFEPLGIPVALVTSGTKERKGDEPITIGTHALLFKQQFKKLGLVVIDEQHRFGVEQRTKLRELGVHPHLLAMTATPIPRTIALVVYSELDLSIIDEMPQGRIPIKTWLVPNEKRPNAYEWIKKQLKTTKSQAFIICPLIEESESETMATVKAVTKEFEVLKKEFSKMKLGLVHGRLKSKEKKDMLDRFGAGSIDILVATPVVEVGIDIPNATIMMIEASERFGLAQLHQLRGRVGRGNKQSYCLLFTESWNEKTRTRLKSMEQMATGSELAELDLKLRGPGDLFGRQQSGYVNFRLADFSEPKLIAAARTAAHLILDKNMLERHQMLQKRLESYTIQRISPN